MSIIQDVASNVKISLAMTAGATTASFNGATIDADYSVAKGVQVVMGAVTANDGSNYMSFTLEHSDDDSNWSAYTEQEAKTTVGLVAGDRIALVYDGPKRYFRLVGTETGTFSVVLSAYGLVLPAELPVVAK
jgi:hypothetical protein